MTHITGMTDTTYTLLSLGDSYTIGEGVPFHENFPSQTVQLLRKSGFHFQVPEVIAKTGWTTDELQTAMNQYTFLPSYDFVTLLIGVNNQYRGQKIGEYESEFENLLKQAIRFSGGHHNRVIVLSIPDWGVTPFAQGKDRAMIGKEIDAYNQINKKVADEQKVFYINITPSTREADKDPFLLATDGLHPSAREYARWAEKLAAIISARL